jgi:mannose-6-phosphate isomerase class I
MRPFLLAPDNFTSPARTPWGGTRLLAKYKAALGVHAPDGGGRVGESWELSAGTELPSRTADGQALPALLAAQPEAMLGDEAQHGRRTSALLVKWLDADDDLSLQIHPRDDYPGLAAGETGKVEAWYVVEAQPGAGFWFGFRPGITERDVRAALAGGDLRAQLCFVPAEAGDLALIEPGMPHAVGRGLTLIEPQRVRPDARALTYRYWDFDRRYDATGRPDPRGTPRALHVEHALAVTAWSEACDPAYAASKRARCGGVERDAAPRLVRMLGGVPDARVRSDALTVSRLSGDGPSSLPAERVLRSLTVIEGSVTLLAEGGRAEPLVVRAGTTAVLPAALPAVDCRLERAHALLCSVLG